MMDFTQYNRRTLGRLAASLLLNGAAHLFGAGRARRGGQVDQRLSEGAGVWRYRQYVVHATVMIGSIPLFSKQAIGGAAVALEQATENGSKVTSVQLTAGSLPERLKGFNRFGASQEVVKERNGAVEESAYLSFMASSREKGFTEARKALSAESATQTFAVARGRATAGGCAFKLQHRMLDAKYTWVDSAAVLKELSSQEGLPPQKPVDDYGPGCLPTFLFSVRRAMARGSDGESSYVHNGKVFRLRVQFKSEPRSGLQVVTGWTVETEERGEAEFKIWLEANDATGLPVKIEFRPRGFLRLTLEADQFAVGQALVPVLGSRRG